ncbi:MAG: M16 family metallopeptidase [Kiloniellaceae bacterium]
MTVEVTKLANGLTVATDHVSTVETVSLGAWVGVGTRHERAEDNGAAHLLEHMAFKGTERRSAYDIAREIEAVGGRLNAYTGRESTAYYAKVLADDAPLAVDIIADILQHPTFDAEELKRERAVVLQEISQAFDTPDDNIFDRFQETAYPGQGLGRPVLGTAKIVRRIDRDTLKGYMARHYGAETMVLAAAGKIEHGRFVALVGEAFDSLPRRAKAEAEPASYRGGDYRERRELEQVHVLLGFHSIGYLDPDHYAALVLSTLFGGGMSSRLFQEVREKRGLVYSIYSFVSAYRDGGLFGIYAGTGEHEVRELIPVVCDELAKLSRDVTEDEVARARVQLKASILMSLESTGSRCEDLAQQILTYGRPLPVSEIVGRIEAVDAGAVRRLARRLAAGRPTLASLGPIGRVEAFDRVAARLG